MIEHPEDLVDAPDRVQANQPSDTVVVEDLDQFVQIIAHWHEQKCVAVQHLLQVPEGTEFQVGDGAEATTVTLSGDMLDGFKFGIEMAMMQLGTLPFAAELEDAPV